jgi:hypothetical protein
MLTAYLTDNLNTVSSLGNNAAGTTIGNGKYLKYTQEAAGIRGKGVNVFIITEDLDTISTAGENTAGASTSVGMFT